jgi:hypothetical protein
MARRIRVFSSAVRADGRRGSARFREVWDMRQLVASILALLLALGIGASALAQDQATPQPPLGLLEGLGYQPLVVTTDGTDLTVGEEIAAGRYVLSFQNNGAMPFNLELIQLPEGMTVDEVLAGFEQAEAGNVPDFFYEDLVFNGGVFAAPGASGMVVLDLPPGEWIFNLFGFNEETGEQVNVPRNVTVIGVMPELEDPQGAVEIGLVDFDFTIPDTISSGPQIWKVTNTGEQPHHLILSRVPDGTTEAEVMELVEFLFAMEEAPADGATPVAHDDMATPAMDGGMATPVAPALSFDQVEDVLEVPVLSTGQTNWIELDLQPGTYVALCFIPDRETGTPHVMLGMVEVFTVE